MAPSIKSGSKPRTNALAYLAPSISDEDKNFIILTPGRLPSLCQQKKS